MLILITLLISRAEASLVGRDTTKNLVVSCLDIIYCSSVNNSLPETVHRAGIFPDSKTFCDMSQIHDQDTTVANYKKLLLKTNSKPTKDDVKKFLDDNFKAEPDSDHWIPPDFNDSPALLNRISNNNIRIFAKHLINYWPALGRKTKKHVELHPLQYSILWTSNGYIIPGGRFREQAYFDSYWIIKGLLICGMKETVKGMLDNFMSIIFSRNNYNDIPRGARVYWRYRSTQPLLGPMIKLYLEQTNDIAWLRKNINTIEQQYTGYWNSRLRTIQANDREYNVSRFGSRSNLPREDQWMADEVTCAVHTTIAAKRICLNSLRAASESVWDFSTRWIYDEEGGINATLSKTNVKRSIPVDLNALICQSAQLLSEFFDKLGNKEKKEEYAKLYKTKLRDMEEIFYNRTDGIWYDFDREKQQHRRYFFLSNFAPLWTDCVHSRKKNYYGRRAVEYIYSQGVDKYEGGVPTSLNQEGYGEWDFPNVWPPLQDIVVTGLYNSGNLKAKRLAKKFATRYIVTSMKAWERTGGGLYDRFDAIVPGMHGTGGAYPFQTGYGWSIGVALSFIEQFACNGYSVRILNPLFYIAVFSLITFLGKMLLC